MKVLKCDKYVCKVFVPYTTLVLPPRSDVFVPVLTLPTLRRMRSGVVIEVPKKTILRVGKRPNVKYYLLDNENEPIELRGVRAKIVGLNTWGWHYLDPRTNERVVTVIYTGVFKAIRY